MGIGEVYAVGGAQAVAALAYGTESIHRVDKVLGPGSPYTVAAQQQVFGVVGIAMPRYCLFGETVTIAEQLEERSRAGSILISQSVYDSLQTLQQLTAHDPERYRVLQLLDFFAYAGHLFTQRAVDLIAAHDTAAVSG